MLPEPEFLILLAVASVFLVMGASVATVVYLWGYRRNSRLLKVAATVPLGCGLFAFVPLFVVLLIWIGYRLFG